MYVILGANNGVYKWGSDFYYDNHFVDEMTSQSLYV